MPHSKKRNNFETLDWFDLRERFQNRILLIDEEVALLWGQLIGELEQNRENEFRLSMRMIAAIALKWISLSWRGMQKIMEATGVDIYYPWNEKTWGNRMQLFEILILGDLNVSLWVSLCRIYSQRHTKQTQRNTKNSVSTSVINEKVYLSILLFTLSSSSVLGTIRGSDE